MALEDRIEIVSVIEETYSLVGRVLATEIPGAVYPGVRPDIMARLRNAEIDPLVTDTEMLSLLRSAYFDLTQTVILLRGQLLGTTGGNYDPPLQQVQLTGSGRSMKVRAWQRALDRILGGPANERPRWIKKAFQWANIILGSLGSVPGIGLIVDPIQELKESVEAQADDDQNPAQ